jgi:hypothetical protein
MYYELWDFASANMIGDYATEEEALAVIRGAVAEHGPAVVMALALGESDEHGNGRMIASGPDLIERAQRASAIVQSA